MDKSTIEIDDKEISNLFIPSYIAIKLKEEFNSPCFGYYNNVTEEIGYCHPINGFYRNSKQKLFYAAPTYDQVLNWLFEKHNLNINTPFDVLKLHFCWEISDVKNRLERFHASEFKTKKEALNNAIEECLTNLIKQ